MYKKEHMTSKKPNNFKSLDKIKLLILLLFCYFHLYKYALEQVIKTHQYF